MIEIAVSLLVAFFCLILFVAFLPARANPSVDHGPAQDGDRIVGLPATHQNHDLLFQREDYDKLRANPHLRPVSRRYWLERRRIALAWLADLEGDVRVLWEFRRFLVLNGLSVTIREELRVALLASFALMYLRFAKGSVLLFGPFVLVSALRSANTPVEWLSARSANLLANAPQETKVRIEREWSKRVAAPELL